MTNISGTTLRRLGGAALATRRWSNIVLQREVWGRNHEHSSRNSPNRFCRNVPDLLRPDVFLGALSGRHLRRSRLARHCPTGGAA